MKTGFPACPVCRQAGGRQEFPAPRHRKIIYHNFMSIESGKVFGEPSEEKEGIEKREELPKGKKEIEGLHERLTTIVRTVSGRMDIEVTTEVDPELFVKLIARGKNPDEEWYNRMWYDEKTKKEIKRVVRIPKSIIEGDEDVAKGKAAHEAGHIAISRAGEFVPDSVMHELGFGAILAASEERPTDQVVHERYAGAGEWVDYARKDDSKRTEVLIKAGKVNIQELPKFAQLCDLIVFEPHIDKSVRKYDPEVEQLYEDIRADVEEVENILPHEDAGEKETKEKSKSRYKTVYSKIWPKVKKLVEKDLEEEQLKQMAGEGMRGQGEGGKSDVPLEELPEKMMEELEKAVERAEEEQKKREETKKGVGKKESHGEPEKKEKEEGKEGGKKEEKEAPGKEPGKPEAETKEGAGAGKKEEEKEGGEEKGKAEEAKAKPSPLPNLSPELRGALKKVFQSLPKEKQAELRQRAEKVLKKLEDIVIKEFSGKLEEMPIETHEEYEARLEEERERKDEEKKTRAEKRVIKEELVEIERRQAAVSKKSHYEQVYNEIRDLDEDLYRRLEEIFTPNIKRKVHLKSTGSKLNLPAIYKWKSARGGGAANIDTRIFESVHLPEKKDYTFTLLNDLSGSMAGAKIREDFKAKVLISEVLNRLGVKFEILGFQDTVIKFKDFDEEFSDEVRKRMSGMIDETLDANPGGHNQSGFNDDGPCLLDASKSLEKQPGREKFLLALSDGLPAGRRSTAEDLTRAVETILTNTNQKLIGLGLGRGTEHVEKFYPTSLPSIDIKKLSQVFGDLLEDMIRNPQNYRYQGGLEDGRK